MIGKTAISILQQAVMHGSYGYASGLFRPSTSGKRGPGKWRRGGGRDAAAVRQLEQAGLVTVSRQTVREFAFEGTEGVCRPTAKAVPFLGTLSRKGDSK